MAQISQTAEVQMNEEWSIEEVQELLEDMKEKGLVYQDEEGRWKLVEQLN